MKHGEIKAKISVFIDNELKENVKNEISAHIGECPDCAAEAEVLKKQDSYLKNVRQISVSASFRAKVNTAIGAKEPVKSGWINAGKLIPIPLALSLLVLIFSIYMAAAPVIYGMNNGPVKASASDMAKNAVMSCLAGGVFAPAAFAKFCGACTQNACTCCGENCGKNCKMGGKSHGN